MPLASAIKAEIITKFKLNDRDTGSSEVQIALLTKRIRHLTEHLKANKKDKHTRYGLQKMVSQRRKLLKYLKRTETPRYQILIKELGLRDSI